MEQKMGEVRLVKKRDKDMLSISSQKKEGRERKGKEKYRQRKKTLRS